MYGCSIFKPGEACFAGALGFKSVLEGGVFLDLENDLSQHSQARDK